jgi:hypothetical protein
MSSATIIILHDEDTGEYDEVGVFYYTQETDDEEKWFNSGNPIDDFNDAILFALDETGSHDYPEYDDSVYSFVELNPQYFLDEDGYLAEHD